MTDRRHAASVILAISADDTSVTIALECDVCGRSEISCAPSHLATLARLLRAAADRQASVNGYTLSEDSVNYH